MLTVPVVPAFVVVVSVTTGVFAVTVTVAPVVASTLVLILALNSVDVILVFKAVAAASSFTFTSYTMTNFLASRCLRLLISTRVMEIIVTSFADTPRDFAMSPSSSVFLPSASASVNPVNSKDCFITFFGLTAGAGVFGVRAGALVVDVPEAGALVVVVPEAGALVVVVVPEAGALVVVVVAGALVVVLVCAKATTTIANNKIVCKRNFIIFLIINYY